MDEDKTYCIKWFEGDLAPKIINEDDEECKLVTTCMLNSVNNMNWNVLVDYMMRIIVNYGSFTFIIVPGPFTPFRNIFFSHMLLDLKKTKFIRFLWGLTESAFFSSMMHNKRLYRLMIKVFPYRMIVLKQTYC